MSSIIFITHYDSSTLCEGSRVGEMANKATKGVGNGTSKGTAHQVLVTLFNEG